MRGVTHVGSKSAYGGLVCIKTAIWWRQDQKKKTVKYRRPAYLLEYLLYLQACDVTIEVHKSSPKIRLQSASDFFLFFPQHLLRVTVRVNPLVWQSLTGICATPSRSLWRSPKHAICHPEQRGVLSKINVSCTLASPRRSCKQGSYFIGILTARSSVRLCRCSLRKLLTVNCKLHDTCLLWMV